MSSPQFTDLVGIPTYFIDTAVPEDAGNGNVRIWSCITRHGVLIPQFEMVIHASKLLIAAQTVRAAAEHAINSDVMMLGAIFH